MLHASTFGIMSSNGLTSIHRACFSAQTSIDLRRATLGTSVTGSVSTVPVDGHRFRPPDSHLSMYLLSYLQGHWHLCEGPQPLRSALIGMGSPGCPEGVGGAHVWPVGSMTGSRKSLREMGQKKPSGAPASMAAVSRSPLLKLLYPAQSPEHCVDISDSPVNTESLMERKIYTWFSSFL